MFEQFKVESGVKEDRSFKDNSISSSDGHLMMEWNC